MNNALVVAQVLPALNNGGVERGTVEVANYLAAQGNKSIVISAGGLMQQKLSEQVEHIQLNVGKKSLLTLALIAKLKIIIKQKNINIVHARSRLPAWLSYKAIAKIKTNKPKFVTTVHGLYSVKKYSSIMARGDTVIAVSQTSADYVEKHYAKYLKSPPVIIYRGIDPLEFPFGFKPDVVWLHNFYQDHQQLVGHKIVLLPGRLTTLKGAKDLLVWLKSNNNDAKLVLTADPTKQKYAAKLQQWCQNNQVIKRVHWIGIHSSMAELYALADVVVSTSSRPESFGRTVLESLSIGTPVIGYNHGGVGEILTKLFPAGKVAIGNTQQLSDKINKLLDTPVQIQPQHPFLLETMLSQTLQVYRETINVC